MCVLIIRYMIYHQDIQYIINKAQQSMLLLDNTQQWGCVMLLLLPLSNNSTSQSVLLVLYNRSWPMIIIFSLIMNREVLVIQL